MKEISINVVRLEGSNPRIFKYTISEDNAIICRRKLRERSNDIVNILKKYKKKGLIKSIWRPKNREMQDHLNQLIKAKKEIKKSIEKIKIYF